MIWLTPEGEQELVETIAGAFTPEDLDFKIADPLEIPPNERSGARDVRERVGVLVAWAKGRDQLGDLLLTALRGNPSNPQLRRLNEAHGLLPPSSALLDLMRDVIPPDDHDAWLRRMGEVQRQVCEININDKVRATGFLVGLDLVMTSALLSGNTSELSDARFTFEGAMFRGHPREPLLLSIPDGTCVLRLDRPAAREAAYTQANVAVRSRGWVAPFFAEPVPGDALVIVHFTDGATRVSLDPHGFTGSEGDEIFFRTASHRGSLGAPCYDHQWQLVGLHLGATADGQNYGRSAKAIRRDVESAGCIWDLARGVHRVSAEKDTASIERDTAELDARIGGIAGTLDSDEGWSPDVEELDIPIGERWAWAEAAAVHASFDPDVLEPFGPASDASRVALLLESRRVGGQWVMSHGLRKRALKRLADRGDLRQAWERNPLDASDPVDVALGRLMTGDPIPASELSDPDALRALLTAVDWLHGLVPNLPDRTRLRASLERATLLAPFRHLTRGFFAGREADLARLTSYVEQHESRPPLFIHAAGGMGKSALLAHFVLTNSRLDPARPNEWRPFLYLDFDRPELDATDLVGVLLAMVRQIGAQTPEVSTAAQALIERDAQRRQTQRRAQRRPSRKKQNLASQLAPDALRSVTDDVAALFATLSKPTPVLLIFDTLEEVQFASPDAIPPLIELVRQLQANAPQLRPVLAGRILADAEVEPMELEGLSPAAAEALLGNELPPEVAANTTLVTRIAGFCNGNPLSLRLAAELVRREARNAPDAIAELDLELQNKLGDAIVQGRLYERILDHIHDEKVGKVAYPGLILRRITWELIRDVLAGPCGLAPIDEHDARSLFEKLAEEVALVRWGNNPDELELRPELRRIVREDFTMDQKSEAQRVEIHTAAVAFYSRRESLQDRAEEIYHRLALGQDPDLVDRRWLSGVEQFLWDAVGELPPAGNAYLANRVGGVSDIAAIEAAKPIEWEEYVGKRAGDLLKFGQPARALELLAMRAERLPASRLHYVESIARRMLPDPDLDGAESAAERAVAAAHAGANPEEIRDALEELVQVRRLRGDNAGVLRGLADLANLGDALGDDLVLLQSEVEGLEAVGGGEKREQFTQNAVRVFNRLDDDLVAKAPELSRRVAAQVGSFDAATLQRVIRVVGTGSLDETAADGLRQVLSTWKEVDEDIGSFVPDASKSPSEVASAARYLISTRDLDSTIASKFASWLGSVVTPKYYTGPHHIRRLDSADHAS